jgi:hypothetical protein
MPEERPVAVQIGYRMSSSEQRRLQKVTGIGMALWRAGNRHAWLMACCPPIVLLRPGSSNLAGFPLPLAGASVDPFPQQVGVAAVAGVLPDHADNHFAQRDGVSVWHSPADAGVGGAGDELLREGDLAAPGLPGIACDRWAGDRAGPVSIG